MKDDIKGAFAQLIKKIYINQNFIWLIFTFAGGIIAHNNHMQCLCKLTVILFIIIGISVIFSAIAYTIDYCAKRIYKTKCYTLRYKYRYDATVANPPVCASMDKVHQVDKLLNVD